MTIDKFSLLLGEFILDRDKVSIPRMGIFLAKSQSATISDNGFTINPPYRKLDFSQDIDENDAQDDDFLSFCSSACGLDMEQTRKEVEEAVHQIDNILKSEGVVDLHGLGKLRRLADGSRFFVMDKDARIDPDGFGLESVSLKNKPDTTPVPQVPAQTKEIAEADNSKTVKTPAVRKKPSVLRKVLVGIILAAILSAAAFFILMNCFPDTLDSILYSPEELEIIKQKGI